MRLPLLLCASVAATSAASCKTTTTTGAGALTVVSVRDVGRAWGSPSIKRIVDLGSGEVVRSGRLGRGSSDGKGTIGERLLIWGDNFGKQPAVVVGDEPASVLAHVDGGGIVVRVPWGVDAGERPVTVTTRRGKDRKSYPVRRAGLVADGAGLVLFTIEPDGKLAIGGRLPLAGARFVAMSHAAAVAYVGSSANGKATLHTIDLSGDRPREHTRDKLDGTRVEAVLHAARAPVAAVLTDSSVVIIDAHRPLTPALYKPQPRPAALRGKVVRDAAVAPDGKRLAVLRAEDNRLVLLDASKPTIAPPAQTVDVAAQAVLPRTVACAFSLDGKQLYVTVGDTRRSIEAGHRAAELLSYGLGDEGPGEPERSALDTVGAPLQMAVGTSEPTPAGTAIRTQIASSAVYVTGGAPALLQGGAGGGQLVRALHGKPAATVAKGDWVASTLAIGGRQQVLVALGSDGGKRALLAKPAWKDSPLSVTSLAGAAATKASAKALDLGAVAVQP